MEKTKEVQNNEKQEKTEEEKIEKKEEKKDEKVNKQSDNSSNLNKNKILKSKKIVYLNQKVYVPVSVPDRIDYIRNLFYDEEVGYIINYAPIYSSSSISEIGKYFKLKLKTILEIASGVLYYIFKSFKVVNQFESKKSQTKTDEIRDTEEILNSGILNSVTEICELYKDICAWSGVEIIIVNGSIKKKGYKIGDSLYKHKWCILNGGEGKSFLIDPFMFMGEERDETQKPLEFNLFYFLTDPKYFIENHIPDEEKYQLLKKPLKVREFTKKLQTLADFFYNNVYKYNFKLNNFYKPEFSCKDSELLMQFYVDNMDIGIDCTLNGKKVPEDKCKLEDNNFRNRYNIKFIFQNNGEYKLNINGKKIGSNTESKVLLIYKINVKVTNIIKHEESQKKDVRKKVVTHLRMGSPQYQKKKVETSLERQLTKCSSDFEEKIKNKCFDNEQSHLFEPKAKVLKIGQDIKFRARVRGAKNVAVLDGRKWKYLKRKDDDIFEGNVVIESESIVLCAMRNKNIYTEVYEFMAIKR